jgi:hypothetical protein
VDIDDVHENIGLVLFVANKFPGAMDQDIQFLDLGCKGFNRTGIPDIKMFECETLVDNWGLHVADRDLRAGAVECFRKRGAYATRPAADQHMLAGDGKIRR